MTSQTRTDATGRIALVQETRFVLVTDSGQSLLLTLSKSVQSGLERVTGAYREQRRVRVSYTGEPGLADCIAHSVVYTESARSITNREREQP